MYLFFAPKMYLLRHLWQSVSTVASMRSEVGFRWLQYFCILHVSSLVAQGRCRFQDGKEILAKANYKFCAKEKIHSVALFAFILAFILAFVLAFYFPSIAACFGRTRVPERFTVANVVPGTGIAMVPRCSKRSGNLR